MAGGPALGSWLTVEYGFDAMFMGSTVLGIIALILTYRLPESLPGSRKVQWKDMNVFRGPVLDWSSWPSSVALLPVAFAFGTFLTITPDFVDSLGYVYKGSFNSIIVASSIAMRFVAGKASDKYGRVPLLVIGGLLLAVGMMGLAHADSKMFRCTIAGLIYGASVGINMPTIFAWTADLAKPGKIALALGTMLMALELGIGFGAVSSGYRFSGNLEAIPRLYGFCAVLGVVSSVFLWIFRKKWA